jgi:ribose 5-phosphate isomerase B
MVPVIRWKNNALTVTVGAPRIPVFPRKFPRRVLLSCLWRSIMKIALASDHAGFVYKEKIREFLTASGHEVRDFGSFSEEPVDYPVFIRAAAEAVACGACERGIVLGGSGNGEAIVANRLKGIRCAVCWNTESAGLARHHNDANMISLGQRMMPPATALDIVRIWLSEPFDGGRHARRIQLIDSPGH